MKVQPLQQVSERRLVSYKDKTDGRTNYTDMLWYSPEALSTAIEACEPVTFKATNMCVVHKELQDNGITFWPSFDHRGEHQLCGAYTPINLKSKNIKAENVHRDSHGPQCSTVSAARVDRSRLPAEGLRRLC